jgi:hypothetical protein
MRANYHRIPDNTNVVVLTNERKLTMKGIVTIYINFHPEYNQDIQQTIDVVLKANAGAMDKICKESDYQLLIVPTTKEACRAEKIDFDNPFPRFLPKTHLDLVAFEKKKAERETCRKAKAALDKELAERDRRVAEQ